MIENNYEIAHKKAMKRDKILLVYLVKRDCLHCNTELMKIMQNKKLSELIEKKAVFVVINKEQKDSYPIEMLYVTEYPTLFFLDKYELFACKTLRTNIEIKEVKSCLHETLHIK